MLFLISEYYLMHSIIMSESDKFSAFQINKIFRASFKGKKKLKIVLAYILPTVNSETARKKKQMTKLNFPFSVIVTTKFQFLGTLESVYIQLQQRKINKL